MMRQTRRYISRISNTTVPTAWLLVVCLLFSSIVIGLGVLELVQSSRLTHFNQCQAAYDDASATARDARAKAQIEQDNALYEFLDTLPPLFKPANPDINKDARKAHRKLDLAIASHEHKNQAIAKHPFPSYPNKSCGGNPA